MIENNVAEYLYNQWVRQKKIDGFHLPEKCPSMENNNNEDENSNNDIIHCGKCCSELSGFDKLDNYEKGEYLKKALELIKSLALDNLEIVSK